MRDCINCSPTCFDHVGSDCITMNDGTSLQSTIDNLREDVDCLKDNVCDPCNNCKDNQGQGSGGSGNSLGNLTQTRSPQTRTSSDPFTITVSPGNSNTSVSYDLRPALTKSTNDVVSVEIFGSQNGVNGRLYKGESTVGSFTASPENFPLTYKAEVISLSPEGQKVYNYQKLITNSQSVTDEFFTVSDFGQTAIESQSDVNDIFDSRIGSIQNQINQINATSFNGISGINSIFANIQSQIDDLSSSTELDVSSLQNSLADLENAINNQSNTISNQQSTISTLQQQVNLILSTLGL